MPILLPIIASLPTASDKLIPSVSLLTVPYKYSVTASLPTISNELIRVQRLYTHRIKFVLGDVGLISSGSEGLEGENDFVHVGHVLRLLRNHERHVLL